MSPDQFAFFVIVDSILASVAIGVMIFINLIHLELKEIGKTLGRIADALRKP